MTAPFTSPDPGQLARVDVAHHGPAVRLTVTGEIDSSSAPELAGHLDDVFDGTVNQLVIDLCGLTFLDSAGLCVLATAHRRASERNISLRVLAATRAVVRPLQITGLWNLLGAEQVDPESADRVVA